MISMSRAYKDSNNLKVDAASKLFLMKEKKSFWQENISENFSSLKKLLLLA